MTKRIDGILVSFMMAEKLTAEECKLLLNLSDEVQGLIVRLILSDRMRTIVEKIKEVR